jgi:tetratricopeptide (TPR) repeat protein
LRPDPLGDREQVFRVVSRYAAAGPTILVLEDLHWADPGAISLIAHLIKRLHDLHAPVLVLGSFRPGGLEPTPDGDRHPLPTMIRESTRFFADPALDLSTAIGGDAGRAFVDAVVAQSISQAPATFRETLFEQTAGLPLFVLGMIHWCRTEGIIGDDGESRDALPWTPDPAILPTEIDMVFAEQVGRLPPHLRALVNAASVQGDAFSAEVTMELLGLDRPSMIDALDNQLTRHFQIVEPGGSVTIAGQGSHTYRFAHVLLREFVYGRLTELEQAHYHAATANAMLKLYGDGEHDGARSIALHFDLAGDQAKAAATYMKAGLYALAHRNFDEAGRHFARIGELGVRRENPFVVAQALIGLGNCAYKQGESTRAAELFARAHDLAQRDNLPLLVANSLTASGWIDYNAGRMLEGADRLGRAIELLTDVGDRHELCRAHVLHSHMLHGIGHFDDAVTAARQAVAIGAELREDMVVVSELTALGNCWLDVGLYEDAMDVNRQAIAICEDHGETHRAMVCWYNISICEFESEAWDRATAALAVMFDPQRRATSRLLGGAEFIAGIVAEGRGNLPEAGRRYRTSFDLRVSNGQDALIVDSLAGLLRVATTDHDYERIRSLIADIEERIADRGLDGVEHYGRLFVTLIDAFTALDDLDEARHHARKGVAFVVGRAELLADPDHRASYLTNVPAHRRLFELASALGVTAGV